jgi:hypothetical protein
VNEGTPKSGSGLFDSVGYLLTAAANRRVGSPPKELPARMEALT